MTITITATHREFLGALARVAPAMYRDEDRYYLRGVCLDWNGQYFTLVATDGHRLHNVRMNEVEVKAAEPFKAILPFRLVEQLLAPEPRSIGDEQIKIEITGEELLSVSVSISDLTLASPLIDGTYPDWRRVIPTEGEGATFAQFNVDYLADVIQAAKSGKAQHVLLRFHPSEPHPTPAITHDTSGGEYAIMPMVLNKRAVSLTEGRALAPAA